MRHTYVLVTESLTPHQTREVGLGPVLLWDTETPYHYIRWVAGNRLMIGGADRPVRAGAGRAAKFGAATRELREHVECLYPALAEVATVARARLWRSRSLRLRPLMTFTKTSVTPLVVIFSVPSSCWPRLPFA